jgi:peptidoglycan-associated lipoprotein
MKQTALYIALALLAAACASKETKTEAPVTDRTTGVQTPQTTQPQGRTTPTTPAPQVAGDPLHDPRNPLSKRSVYFDFDSNSVKDEYRGLITAHSRYMTGDKKDSKIRIEGNCDERGSREYNLALGQRRAEAVKKVMTVLGVQDGRIETISYGEEKPVAMGHDESSWQQNRRADIKYAGER